MKSNNSAILHRVDPMLLVEGTTFVAVQKGSTAFPVVVSGVTGMNGWLADNSFGFWSEQHKDRLTGQTIETHNYINVQIDGVGYEKIGHPNDTLYADEWHFYIGGAEKEAAQDLARRVNLEVRTRKNAKEQADLEAERARIVKANIESHADATARDNARKKADLLAQIRVLQAQAEAL